MVRFADKRHLSRQAASRFTEPGAEKEKQRKDPGIEAVGPGPSVDQADISLREFCKAALQT